LHVDWGGISSNVDFRDDIVQKCFLDSRVLQQIQNTIQYRTHKKLVISYRDQNVEQVFQDGKLGDQLLHYFAEGFKYAVVVDRRLVEAQMNLVVAYNGEVNCKIVNCLFYELVGD